MRFLHMLIHLYPQSWRRRYQDEFLAMLDQYKKPRFVDIFDIVIGALDAHVQNAKGGITSMVDEHNLDKAHAQKRFMEGISRYQLPIVFHDVKYNDNHVLSFSFFADERVDLLPLAKEIAHFYNQKVEFKQVGKLQYKDNARNYR